MNGRNLGVLLAVVVVAVVGFVIASGSEDDKDSKGGSTTSTTTTTRPDTATTTEAVEPPPRPKPPSIVVRDGKPVGGVKDIEVDKGDRVEFTVRSDVAEEVHVHGYDVSKDVEAGGRVSFGFKADIDGSFEVELEHSAEQIADLRVNP
jgi:hypothetical protein